VSLRTKIEIMIILNARVAPPDSPVPPVSGLTSAPGGVPVALVHGRTS
jgi:hypothetical protein